MQRTRPTSRGFRAGASQSLQIMFPCSRSCFGIGINWEAARNWILFAFWTSRIKSDVVIIWMESILNWKVLEFTADVESVCDDDIAHCIQCILIHLFILIEMKCIVFSIFKSQIFQIILVSLYLVWKCIHWITIFQFRKKSK